MSRPVEVAVRFYHRGEKQKTGNPDQRRRIHFRINHKNVKTGTVYRLHLINPVRLANLQRYDDIECVGTAKSTDSVSFQFLEHAGAPVVPPRGVMMIPTARSLSILAVFSFSLSGLASLVSHDPAAAQQRPLRFGATGEERVPAPRLGRRDFRIGDNFENRLENLVLRRLRRGIDRPFGLGQRGAIPAISVTGGTANALSIVNNRNDASGLLREYSPDGGRKPEALVIKVPEHLKRLGEKRADQRALAFEEEGEKRQFGYYRDNEAYDLRFPSVVYLRSPD